MTLDPTVVLAVITALASGLGAAMLRVYSDLRKDRDAALADVRRERDDWKSLAIASERDITRLASVIERVLKVKVPSKP